MCSLEFGKHRTHRKGCDSEQAEKQGRATGMRQEGSRVSHGPGNQQEGDSEPAWKELKLRMRTPYPINHHCKTPVRESLRKPQMHPLRVKGSHEYPSSSEDKITAPAPFSFSSLPPGTISGRVRNNSYSWERSWSVRKSQPALRPPLAPDPEYWAGMDRDANMDENRKFLLLCWARQLPKWDCSCDLNGWNSMRFTQDFSLEMTIPCSTQQVWSVGVSKIKLFICILAGQTGSTKWLHLLSLLPYCICLLSW